MQTTPKDPRDSPVKEDGSYYYDDAHGYQDFDPEEEEEEETDEGADLGGGGFDVDLD